MAPAPAAAPAARQPSAQSPVAAASCDTGLSPFSFHAAQQQPAQPAQPAAAWTVAPWERAATPPPAAAAATASSLDAELMVRADCAACLGCAAAGGAASRARD